MTFQLTAVFRKVPEGYIGFVEELPGTNTQGDTLAGFLKGKTNGRVLTIEEINDAIDGEQLA